MLLQSWELFKEQLILDVPLLFDLIFMLCDQSHRDALLKFYQQIELQLNPKQLKKMEV